MLTEQKRLEFERTGLTAIRGAIDRADTAAMADRIWDHLCAEYGLARDDPDTWVGAHPVGFRAITGAPEFAAIDSPAVRSGLDDLLGVDGWRPPRRWGRLLVTLPRVPAGEWVVPNGVWHNDFLPPSGAGEPRPRAVQLFAILADLAPTGGGTLVLTGSHRLIRRHQAESEAAAHPKQLRRLLGVEPQPRS